MTKSFIDYLMCPIFNIYYFIDANDFQNDYFFFFTSEILSLIIVFFGCVYNEYKTSDYSLSENLNEEEDNSSSGKISEILLEENT